MMRYVVIDPCDGYTYKGNGFLVLLGYGGSTTANTTGYSSGTLIIRKNGSYAHICTLTTLNQTATLGAVSVSTTFNRGVMVNGDTLTSAEQTGADIAIAIECDTLEEAALLL